MKPESPVLSVPATLPPASLEGMLHPEPTRAGRPAPAVLDVTDGGRRSAGGPSGRMLWQGTVFTIEAWVQVEQRDAHLVASGDFSTQRSAAVLQGALIRLGRFRGAISIDTRAVTRTGDATAGVLNAHRDSGHACVAARSRP